MKYRFLSAGALLIGVFLVACGGDDGYGGSAATATRPAATATAPAAAATAGVPSTVAIIDFGFSPNQFSVAAGQTVRFTVKNDGAINHTFTIDGVVNTGTLSGGASKEVSFTPAAAGTLTFYCQVHGQAAMSGTIRVS